MSTAASHPGHPEAEPYELARRLVEQAAAGQTPRESAQRTEAIVDAPSPEELRGVVVAIVVAGVAHQARGAAAGNWPVIEYRRPGGARNAALRPGQVAERGARRATRGCDARCKG